MTLKKILNNPSFEILYSGESAEGTEVSQVFCCDLLSIAMAKAPAGSVWVTVMGNVNAVAVAALTEISCILLAEGVTMDEPGLARARMQGVPVLRTELPVFDAGLLCQKALDES